MATGQSAQPGRGIVTSDVTPGVDFRDGSPELWDSAGRLARSVEQALKPGLERRARELGAADGADAAKRLAAGEDATVNRPRFAFGPMAEAREEAAVNAFHARSRNDVDAREAQARLANPADPDAYRREMESVRSAFIQGAPPEFAVDLETYLNDRIEQGVASVAGAASAVSLREEATDLAGREGNLRRQMVDSLDRTGGPSIEYEILRNEWETLRDQRLANPAIPYSAEEAAEDERELVALSKGAIYTAHAREQFRTDGASAALAAVQEILTDPDLGATDRAIVFERVRSAINTEIDVATDQANLANAARERASREIERRIENYAGAIEVGAELPALTEAEILASPGGMEALAKFHRLTAEAAERNRLTGTLVGLPREEALARARQALSGGNGTDVLDLSKPLDQPGDFDALAAAVRMVETGNNPARTSADPDGAGPAGGGAFGAMQLLPETARRMARLEGVAYDERRLLNDAAYNERLGKRYLRELLTRYNGDAMLAVTAYHAGEGAVDAWLQPVDTRTMINGVPYIGKGDPRTGEITVAQWIDRIERAGNPRSAEYPRKVARALGGGRASAEWADQQAAAIVTNATEGYASDPIRFAAAHRLAAPIALPVDGAFAVGSDGQAWQAGLRARAALGQDLADRHQVPLRYFTDGEVTAYRDRFERDPTAALDFAQSAVAAVGAQGARNALAEVGQGDVAPVLIHVADLAATGGDTRFADQAAAGLSLKAGGQTLDAETREELQARFNIYRGSLRSQPSLMNAVYNAAEAAALADTVAGRSQPAEYYVQAALGRTRWQGRDYGGAANVNGNNIVVPRWLNPEYADDALEALAGVWTENNTGPVYGNDQPIPARDIARMRMSLMPNGRYRLVDARGGVAYARSGQPFEINMEGASGQGRAFLARRLGVQAVRPEP